MVVSSDSNRYRNETKSKLRPTPDVRVVIPGGPSIRAYSAILATASLVLQVLLSKLPQRRNEEKTIHIHGVPYSAVVTFVRLLHCTRSTLLASKGTLIMAIEKHGIGLLVLSHVYQVRWLKQLCEHGLAQRLVAGNVVDILKIARECDAQWLYQRCMKVVTKDFVAVRQSEGWKFIEKNDQKLVQQILQFLQETEQRKRRWRREREYQKVYLQLSAAMDCLQNIFSHNSKDIVNAPHDQIPKNSSCSSSRFGSCEACEGLKHLVRHMSTCNNKLSPKGCAHCKRMWQLLRLHSSICDQSGSCKVPLCKQFKVATESQKGEDEMWRLLVKKVVSARVMASLAKRRRPQVVQNSWATYRNTNQICV